MCPHVGEDVGHSLRTHVAKQTLRDLAAGKVLPAVPHHKFAQLVAGSLAPDSPMALAVRMEGHIDGTKGTIDPSQM